MYRVKISQPVPTSYMVWDKKTGIFILRVSIVPTMDKVASQNNTANEILIPQGRPDNACIPL